MFHLPPQDHKAREAMGDMAHVAEVLNPANVGKMLVVWQAVREARRMFEGGGIKPARVFYIIIRADSGERWLISVGPRGGWRKEWNFGKGY